MAMVCKDCRRSMEQYTSKTEHGHPLIMWKCTGCGRTVEELPDPGDGNSYK